MLKEFGCNFTPLPHQIFWNLGMCYLSPSPVVVAGRISADIKFSCSFICHLGTFKQVYYMLHGGIHAWLK